MSNNSSEVKAIIDKFLNIFRQSTLSLFQNIFLNQEKRIQFQENVQIILKKYLMEFYAFAFNQNEDKIQINQSNLQARKLEDKKESLKAGEIQQGGFEDETDVKKYVKWIGTKIRAYSRKLDPCIAKFIDCMVKDFSQDNLKNQRDIDDSQASFIQETPPQSEEELQYPQQIIKNQQGLPNQQDLFVQNAQNLLLNTQMRQQSNSGQQDFEEKRLKKKKTDQKQGQVNQQQTEEEKQKKETLLQIGQGQQIKRQFKYLLDSLKFTDEKINKQQCWYFLLPDQRFFEIIQNSEESKIKETQNDHFVQKMKRAQQWLQNFSQQNTKKQFLGVIQNIFQNDGQDMHLKLNQKQKMLFQEDYRGLGEQQQIYECFQLFKQIEQICKQPFSNIKCQIPILQFFQQGQNDLEEPYGQIIKKQINVQRYRPVQSIKKYLNRHSNNTFQINENPSLFLRAVIVELLFRSLVVGINMICQQQFLSKRRKHPLSRAKKTRQGQQQEASLLQWKVNKIMQLNKIEFKINGELRSAFFIQFYNHKINNKKKIKEYTKKFVNKMNSVDKPLKNQLLTEKQIYNCSKKEIQQLQNQFIEWGRERQKQNWKFEQECYTHRLRVYYLCSNQILKDKIYLCNQCIQCIQDNSDQFQQENNEIQCKKHKMPIKRKLSVKKEEVNNLEQKLQDQQMFTCERCKSFNNGNIICCRHYKTIDQLCIQEHCIETDEFLLCQTCLSSKSHQPHTKVLFNRGQLIKKFELPKNKTFNINAYQRKLISSKQKLRLYPLQKIKISWAKIILPTIKLLESFAVHEDKIVNNWVSDFFKEVKKEQLMVLREVLRINEENFDEQDIFSYLEAFNYGLQGQLQRLFEPIKEIMLNSCKKINQLKDINKVDANIKLNQIYQQVFDIQTNDEILASPMKLSDLNTICKKIIHKIIVIKWNESQRDQTIRKNWIEKLKNYSLPQQYNNANRQLRKKLKKCEPWAIIKSNQFSNLRVLHIEYLRYHQQQTKRQYLIDAFELFWFINNNTQIEQVTIKGVGIKNIQSLIEQFNPKSSSKKSGKQYQPWANLKLTLQTTYRLHPRIKNYAKFNVETAFHRLECLQYFHRQFRWLSGITIVIEYASGNQKYLEKLLRCLRTIRDIRIVVKRIKPETLRWLLNRLSLFTKIASLIIEHIQISLQQLSIDQLPQMEQSLTALLNNNTIKQLSLRNCSNFPSFPTVTTLHFLQLSSVKFRKGFDVNAFIKDNHQLKSISVGQMKENQFKIQEQMLNQLQHLSIKDCQDVYFANISPAFESKLNYLCIENNFQKSISINSLKEMFPKFSYLIQLKLRNFDFGYELLSVIPSNLLEQIEILRNTQITDNDIKLIDSKWLYLKKISFGRANQCPLITEEIFCQCKFKGLMEITINQHILNEQNKKYLRSRGIQYI